MKKLFPSLLAASGIGGVISGVAYGEVGTSIFGIVLIFTGVIGLIPAIVERLPAKAG